MGQLFIDVKTFVLYNMDVMVECMLHAGGGGVMDVSNFFWGMEFGIFISFSLHSMIDFFKNKIL